jgi:uncharacterized protein YjdB
MLFFLMACGTGPPSGGAKSADSLSQIQITPQSPTLTKGGTLQLTATAVYTSGKRQDVSASVAWKTSTPTVATVDATGKLTAIGVGSAQVSAQYQGVTGTNSVTVNPASLISITVAPNPSSLPVGESEQLTATGTFSDGSTQDLTASASWTSSQTGIASVNASGFVTANAVGTATISATSSTITGSAQVAVAPPVPIALSIVPSTLSMVLGSSRQLHATATYSDGTNQDATGQVLWSSNAPNTVSVSAEGLSTAQQVGTATVSASLSSLNADAPVTVMPLALVSYFDLASAQQAQLDGTVRVTNPGFNSGDLCAMIYVFDNRQEMNECCGCKVSDSGLLTLSLENDLTSNPLTGRKPKTGVIRIVPSDPTSNPQCDASALSPAGELVGWESNVLAPAGGTPQIVESESDLVSLSNGESSVLAGECGAIKALGGGQGICSCGKGGSAKSR